MACSPSLWCAGDPWPCHCVLGQVTQQTGRLWVASTLVLGLCLVSDLSWDVVHYSCPEPLALCLKGFVLLLGGSGRFAARGALPWSAAGLSNHQCSSMFKSVGKLQPDFIPKGSAYSFREPVPGSRKESPPWYFGAKRVEGKECYWVLNTHRILEWFGLQGP